MKHKIIHHIQELIRKKQEKTTQKWTMLIHINKTMRKLTTFFKNTDIKIPYKTNKNVQILIIGNTQKTNLYTTSDHHNTNKPQSAKANSSTQIIQ